MHSIVSATVWSSIQLLSLQYILDILNKSTQLPLEIVLQHITANNLFTDPVLTTLCLTLWRPLLPYGHKKHSVPDRVKPSFVIFDIQTL